MRTFVSKKWFIFPLVILVIVILFSAGCGTIKKTGTTTQPVAATSSPHPPVRTGDIETGTKVDAVSQSISSTGGMVAVSKSGDTLDGFVIDVPVNSYSNSLTFKVSYAPITGQTFGADITPISPMISVDNGGTYANEMMIIRVPVKVPEGYFAMGFFYDAATKQLEGMPLVSSDADSVTVGSIHFSDFFISMISKTLLPNDIDSGFRPGVDDWQFVNDGSYIAPGGHCEGQSLSALWYYTTRPDGKNTRLYGLYDNNGDKPATPALWQDDSLGYRFASVIQADIKNSTFANDFWLNANGKDVQKDANGKWQLVDVPGIGDESIWDLFAYSLQATQEPQLVLMRSDAGGGHAMICYRINEGNLYIADPNYPGKTDRMILYSDGVFTPYNSGANAAEIEKGNGKTFESIMYYAKSTVLPWNKISQRWTEFKDKTIGNVKFPNYTIVYNDDQGSLVPLSDGLNTPYDSISIGPLQQPGVVLGIRIFRDGEILQYDSKGNVDLQPGNNKLGIEVLGQVDDDYEFIDFKYFNVVYGNLAIDPPTMDGAPDESYTFTARVGNLPDKAHVEWFVDNIKKQSGTDLIFQASFEVGSHTVSVKLFDANGKETQTADSSVNISAEASLLAQLQKMKTISGFFQGKYNGNPGNGDLRFTVIIPLSSATTTMDIIWNGTSFSGTVTGTADGGTQTNTVSGTVSGDGKILTSFVYTLDIKYTGSSGEHTINLELKNIPFDKDISGNASAFSLNKYGSELKPLLVNYEEHTRSYTNGKLVSETAHLLDTISWNYDPQFAIYLRK